MEILGERMENKGFIFSNDNVMECLNDTLST